MMWRMQQQCTSVIHRDCAFAPLSLGIVSACMHGCSPLSSLLPSTLITYLAVLIASCTTTPSAGRFRISISADCSSSSYTTTSSVGPSHRPFQVPPTLCTYLRIQTCSQAPAQASARTQLRTTLPGLQVAAWKRIQLGQMVRYAQRV